MSILTGVCIDFNVQRIGFQNQLFSGSSVFELFLIQVITKCLKSITGRAYEPTSFNFPV